MRDFDIIMKIMAILVVLLAIFLFSGGTWESKEINGYLFRMNKITGTTQYIDGVHNGWKTVGDQ